MEKPQWSEWRSYVEGTKMECHETTDGEYAAVLWGIEEDDYYGVEVYHRDVLIYEDNMLAGDCDFPESYQLWAGDLARAFREHADRVKGTQ